MSEPKAHWWNQDRFNPPIQYTPTPEWIKECELAAARLRARLSVLNLTERDKKFLRAVKVAF